MNATTTTNAGGSRPARTNKTTLTVIVGFLTLILGMAIGAAAAETGTGLLRLSQKTSPATNQTLSAAAGGLNPGGTAELNPFQQIRDMQAQMAKSFDRMFQQFGASPQFNSFTINPGSSLALDVQNLKNRYEIQAYVPDAKSSDVHVSLKDGRTLDVQVSHQQTQTTGGKNAASSVAEWGQYDQEVQLPTPVKAGQMKIKREGHELIITIPKTA